MELLGLWRMNGQDLDMCRWSEGMKAERKAKIGRHSRASGIKDTKQLKLLVEQSGHQQGEWAWAGVQKLSQCQDIWASLGGSACCYQPTSHVLVMGSLHLKASCLWIVSTYISFVLIFTRDLLSSSHISDVTCITSFTPHCKPMRVSIFISPFFRQRNQSS